MQAEWLNRIANFIKEYAGNYPGYSHLALAQELQSKFNLQEEVAVQLAARAEQELNTAKLGLAAIELNLTFNCNLTCDYCFVHCKSPHERMSLQTAQASVDLLLDRAIFPNVVITLIGGEPLLEFDLIQQLVPYALEQAGQRNLEITWAVTTNGTLLNKKILEFFAHHKINILISMDGGQKTHDRYRRTRSGEGTWQKIASLIPLVCQYQPWLGARMTVSPEAIDTMQEDFKAIVELGFKQLIIAPAQGASQWSRDQIEKYGLNMVKILEDYHHYKGKGVPLYIEEFEKDEHEPVGWGCRAGSTSLAVAPNGDLSPCSKLLGLTDETGKYVVGNVRTHVNMKKLQPFQNAISRMPRHCKGCTRTCAGGCYAVNFEQTGDHFTPSQENCMFWVVGQELKRMSSKIKYFR